MKRSNLFVAAAVATLLLAVPVVAGPDGGRGAAVAEQQFSGTLMTVSPHGAYGSAEVRISGPAGFALTKRFAGGAIAVDLLADSETARSALIDGRYRFEIVFDRGAGMKVSSGSFYVQNGAAISRQQMVSRLSAVQGELNEANAERRTLPGATLEGPSQEAIEDDFVFVNDTAEDGFTYLELESNNNPPDDADWQIENDDGDLEINQEGGTAGSGNRLTIVDGGAVGFGTLAPQDVMHAVSGKSNSFVRIENTSAGETWRFGVDSDGDFDVILQATNGPGATGTKFTIEDANGRVGIAQVDPEADFHLENADGAGDTVFKIAAAGQGSWNIGMRAANGVFTFNKVGTPQEFSVREANHAVATLDVEGHVRGTSFKSTSSRALKTGFEAIDPAEVLAKVSQLPVTAWRYKTEADGVKHLGPVAEDFKQLFGLGDGTTITSVDADGVALAAIQGLNTRLQAEVEAKDNEIAVLKARLVAIEEKLAALTP